MSGISSAKIIATVATATAVCMIGPGITHAEAASVPLRVKAMKVAEAQKGDRYQYGAVGPSRFDCSGLIYYSYKKEGKKLPRTAQAQYNKSKHISAKSRKAGDLVFFGGTRSIYHVGIYVGNGKIVNANTGSYRGRKVVVAPVSEYGHSVHYGRI